jgi:hypothetical protein
MGDRSGKSATSATSLIVNGLAGNKTATDQQQARYINDKAGLLRVCGGLMTIDVLRI